METEADINRTVEAAAEIICKGDAEVSIDPVDLNIKDNLIDPISSMRQSLSNLKSSLSDQIILNFFYFKAFYSTCLLRFRSSMCLFLYWKRFYCISMFFFLGWGVFSTGETGFDCWRKSFNRGIICVCLVWFKSDFNMFDFSLKALIKRNQDLTPTPNEQTQLLNLITKIQTILDNLIISPGDFDACVCIKFKSLDYKGLIRFWSCYISLDRSKRTDSKHVSTFIVSLSKFLFHFIWLDYVLYHSIDLKELSLDIVAFSLNDSRILRKSVTKCFFRLNHSCHFLWSIYIVLKLILDFAWNFVFYPSPKTCFFAALFV